MIILIALMLIIAGWQIPRLIQEKSYKELFVFIILWFISGAYASIVVLDIKLISPFELITAVVDRILKILPL